MVTIAQLTADPHPHLARLRAESPIAWVPAMGAWLVTGRATAIEVMRDADRFTVDDPRFSTGRVVGPSMLSTDGVVHARHRAPFASAFRPALTRERLTDVVDEIAGRRVARALTTSPVDLRSAVAGPVAAEVAIAALGLVDTDPAEVLGWYGGIVAAVSAIGADPNVAVDPSLMDGIRAAVERTVAVDTALGTTRAAAEELSDDEFVSDVGVVLFGALETSEAMIANLLRVVVADRAVAARLAADPDARAVAVEESLRLEPGAATVDRYVVHDLDFAGERLQAGDPVVVSLSAANRDPAVHAHPDRFSLDRVGEPPHLAFATGPHVCLGAHLARMEARAVLDAWWASPRRVEPAAAGFDPPTGLVFRKPDRLMVEVVGT